MTETAKLVIVARKDLKKEGRLKKGKLAAHVTSAAITRLVEGPETPAHTAWVKGERNVVVLWVKDLDHLLEVQAAAHEQNLDTYLEKDRDGTITTMAIGPGFNSVVDRVTGDLELI